MNSELRKINKKNIKHCDENSVWFFYKKREIFIDKEENQFYYRIHQPDGLLFQDGWEQSFQEALTKCLNIF